MVRLSADEAYARWDEIRDSLQHCITKTRSRYRTEDAFLRVRVEPPSAWVYEIGPGHGFVIFTQEFDADGLVLFVWALCAKPNALSGRKGEVYAELERIARECKAKRIRMQSPRSGWSRELFFDQVAIVYEHEVTT